MVVLPALSTFATAAGKINLIPIAKGVECLSRLKVTLPEIYRDSCHAILKDIPLDIQTGARLYYYGELSLLDRGKSLVFIFNNRDL